MVSYTVHSNDPLLERAERPPSFSGEIDDMRLYSRALGDLELSLLVKSAPRRWILFPRVRGRTSSRSLAPARAAPKPEGAPGPTPAPAGIDDFP
jgi:hypothetical protein